MTRRYEISIDRERFPVDPWGLVQTDLDGDDGGLTGTLFAIGNGYLGMRADWSPDPQAAGTYVNGFHETFPIVYPETAHALAKTGQSILNAPDAKSLSLSIGGEVLRVDPGHERRSSVEGFRREIDFRSGVLRTELVWNTAHGRASVVSERLVSFERRHLAAMRLTVTPLDSDATVELTAPLTNRQDLGVPGAVAEGGGADPRRGRIFDHRVLDPVLATRDESAGDGGTVTLGFRAHSSGMRIVASQRQALDAPGEVDVDGTLTPDEATTTFRTDVAAGRTLTLTTFAAYHSAGQTDHPAEQATVEELADAAGETVATAAAAGWDQLVAEQQRWLDRFWHRTDVEIDGDDSAQQAIRWNLFQMAQASANVGERGVAAKGVSAGGYDGHYFWDTEVYVIPMLAYTNPAAARDLLGFRYRTLDAARQRAIEMSQRGALYPWRTINGEEASAYYPAGTAQYHIDADVAHAIDRYVTATDDTQFLRHEGAEMLVEIARLFFDLGFFDRHDPPAFHLHGVTGPDEYTAVVDDNVYTNVMARFALRFAARVVETLRAHHPDDLRRLVDATGLADGEVDDWLRAADAMCVLYDAELGINPQDDAFLEHEPWDWDGVPDEKYPLLLNFHPLVIYRHQVLKQADVVLANYLRGNEFDPDLQRRNFDFYDPITTGDSSLSACVQSIMASEVGHPELAMRYFDASLYLDIADTHDNTVDGVHIANVGGVWAELIHGFAGMRDHDEHLRFVPRLPAAWRSMRFRLHRRGNDLAVTVERDGLTVQVESGDPVPVLVDGSVRSVAAGESVRIPAAS